jgi:predicted permease
MFCGYALSRRSVLNEEGERVLTALLARFAVPVLMFRNGYVYMTPEFLGNMGLWLLLPAGIILLMMAAAVLLCRVLHMREHSRGLISMMSSLSNVLYLGIPVITAIFGDSGMPYIMAYNISNTVICWTLGEMGIAADSGIRVRFLKGFLKSLIAPAMVGMYLGIGVAFTRLVMPAFINASAGYISGLVSPLALLIAGSILARMGNKALKLSKEGVFTIIMSVIILPVFTLVVCMLLRAPMLMTQIFTILSAMPIMSQAMIASRQYNADYKLAAQMMASTSLLSMAAIPLFVIVMQRLY